MPVEAALAGAAIGIVDVLLYTLYRTDRMRFRRPLYWVFPLVGAVIGGVAMWSLGLPLPIGGTVVFGITLMNWQGFNLVARNGW